MARPGKARQARHGAAGPGRARLGKARQARRGMARLGVARHSKAGTAWQGTARPGTAGQGRAGKAGMAGPGSARHGKARQGRHRNGAGTRLFLESKMASQNAEILDYLKTGRSITPSTALHNFRCFRLAARICDLKHDGHNILTTTVKRRSKRTGRMLSFAEYSLEGS